MQRTHLCSNNRAIVTDTEDHPTAEENEIIHEGGIRSHADDHQCGADGEHHFGP